MSQAQNQSPSFVKAFIPGLIVGLIVGGFAGAFIPPLLESGAINPLKPSPIRSGPPRTEERATPAVVEPVEAPTTEKPGDVPAEPAKPVDEPKPGETPRG